MRIIVSVGTRPEIIKMAPVHSEMRRSQDLDPVLVHTGQHYDWEMSEAFFEDLEVGDPDYHLGVGSGDPALQTAEIMARMGELIRRLDPDCVMAVGDTNSVLGSALAASKLDVPFVHVEAGLRSFDMTMPEEVNRRLVDHLASLNSAPTVRAFVNLTEEGFPRSRILLSGNTVVDALYSVIDRIGESKLPKELNLDGRSVLITMHRRENVDVEWRLRSLIESIRRMIESLQLSVVWPLHPRTEKMLHRYGLYDTVKSWRGRGLHLTGPLKYIDFLAVLSSVDLVATDSGGVQEEAVTLKKPVIVLRDNTERPEIVEMGVGRVVGVLPEEVVGAISDMMENLDRIRERYEALGNPFGDGKASKRIVDLVTSHYEAGSLNFSTAKFSGGSPHYVTARLSEGLNGVKASDLEEKTGYEIVSVYDESGRPVFFDKATRLRVGYVIRLRGDPVRLGSLVRVMGGSLGWDH